MASENDGCSIPSFLHWVLAQSKTSYESSSIDMAFIYPTSFKPQGKRRHAAVLLYPSEQPSRLFLKRRLPQSPFICLTDHLSDLPHMPHQIFPVSPSRHNPDTVRAENYHRTLGCSKPSALYVLLVLCLIPHRQDILSLPFFFHLLNPMCLSLINFVVFSII